MRRTRLTVAGSAAVAVALVATPAASAAPSHRAPAPTIDGFKKIVVIYEENHSFDNLYGGWGSVGGKQVAGIGSRGYVARAPQVDQNGALLACLPQVDVNLTSPPLPASCGSVTMADGTAKPSAFLNEPFSINDYIKPTDNTCPPGSVFAPNGVLKDSPGSLPGGCTRDIVHRFYNEQFQLDGGKQDRYTLGSDAAGLTQGHYETTQLPIYRYLHRKNGPNYVVADQFFQGAFGGSFLNHQFLITARAPVWAGWTAANPAHSVLDANGMPTSTPLYTAGVPAGSDNILTQACDDPAVAFGTKGGRACGDVAVNTVQPFSQPYAPTTADARRLPPVDDNAYPNIGDRLSSKGVSWAWYSGGWDNAAGNVGGDGWTNGTTPGTCTDQRTIAKATYPYCAGNLFQFHHQPFNYFANYGEGKVGRSHLQDEATFMKAARRGTLPTVSFVKPYGEENEHPGYASTENGEQHLVDLVKAVENGKDGKDTLIVVTYDEFGGQWDHVPPPGQGAQSADAAHDVYGPGTRIPALLISKRLRHSTVDSTPYDTTSIIATIERSFGLAPVDNGFNRDGKVNDLGHAVAAAGVKH